MAPAGVAIHAARVYFGPMASDPSGIEPIELAGLRAYLRPPLLDDAAALAALAFVNRFIPDNDRASRQPSRSATELRRAVQP
jgi:hypothetical protein